MLLITMTGTSHAGSHFQCTLIGNSFLNRRKERLREVVQLAKGQTLESIDPGLEPLFL